MVISGISMVISVISVVILVISVIPVTGDKGLLCYPEDKGEIFSRPNIETVFLILSRQQVWHFMQIVSNRDTLHEIP